MPETEIVILKVGQADAIVLLSGDHAALIDTGEKEDGEEIVRFLSERGIRSLDLMIITHFDKDHVGGADTVLMGMRVRAVYDADYEPNSKQYRTYSEAIKTTGVPRYRVRKDLLLEMGDLSFVLRPTALQDVSDNDRSLAVIVKDPWHRFFFAGDAEDARLNELIQAGLQNADLIKMPHHGRFHYPLPEFLTALNAEIAIITDSRKNPAQDETLILLREMGMEIFQTANGEIHIMSGNKGITVFQ